MVVEPEAPTRTVSKIKTKLGRILYYNEETE